MNRYSIFDRFVIASLLGGFLTLVIAGRYDLANSNILLVIAYAILFREDPE